MSEQCVNVDSPNRTCTIHHASCRFALQRHPTEFKEVDGLGRNGGWLAFHGDKAAIEFVLAGRFTGRPFTWKTCSNCGRPEE